MEKYHALKCLFGLFIYSLTFTITQGHSKSIATSKEAESEGRVFWRLPSAAFLPSQLVPWTVLPLLLLLPLLCLAAGLQYFVTLFGPSNIYLGPSDSLRPTLDRTLRSGYEKLLEDELITNSNKFLKTEEKRWLKNK